MVLFGALGLGSVYARIGASIEQCTVLYGNAIHSNINNSSGVICWIKSGIKVVALFERKKCIALWVQKIETDEHGINKKFSDDEIVKLLDANKGTSDWKKNQNDKDAKMWLSVDKSRLARLSEKILIPIGDSKTNDGLPVLHNVLMIYGGAITQNIPILWNR